MVLRLTLDVNVWVNHYLAVVRGRPGSAAQSLVRSSLDGHCRLGPIQLVISYRMLETLRQVLFRLGAPEALADAARDAVAVSAFGGVLAEPPHIVLGGGVQPIKDAEDGGVLDLAIAGRSDLLVTNNIGDFVSGPRADVDSEVLRRNPLGNADVLLFRHPGLPEGLAIASVFAAKAWLADGAPPPAGILQRFLMN